MSTPAKKIINVSRVALARLQKEGILPANLKGAAGAKAKKVVIALSKAALKKGVAAMRDAAMQGRTGGGLGRPASITMVSGRRDAMLGGSVARPTMVTLRTPDKNRKGGFVFTVAALISAATAVGQAIALGAAGAAGAAVVKKVTGTGLRRAGGLKRAGEGLKRAGEGLTRAGAGRKKGGAIRMVRK